MKAILKALFLQMAKTFLVRCLKPTIDLETLDILQYVSRSLMAMHNSCGYKSRLEMTP